MARAGPTFRAPIHTGLIFTERQNRFLQRRLLHHINDHLRRLRRIRSGALDSDASVFHAANMAWSSQDWSTSYQSRNISQLTHYQKKHIATKLLLERGMHVLDIGSGWGGLAISLAQDCDVEITGVTLSEEQLRLSNARAHEAGIADRVRFLCSRTIVT